MYPLPVNFTLPTETLVYANTVTGGWFWTLILLTVYIVVYTSLSYSTHTMKAFTAASFFGGMLSVFLYVMNLIQELALIISLILAIATFVMLLFSQSQYE